MAGSDLMQNVETCNLQENACTANYQVNDNGVARFLCVDLEVVQCDTSVPTSTLAQTIGCWTEANNGILQSILLHPANDYNDPTGLNEIWKYYG